MGLHEDAVELRKRICAVAPNYLKKELGDNVWEIALLSSKAYWQANDDSVSGFTLDDVEFFRHMYLEGRSLIYMAASAMCGLNVVKSALRAGGMFVVDDPFFSIPWMHQKFPNGEVPAPMLLAYPGLLQHIALIKCPEPIHYRPDNVEVDTITYLSKGFSNSEIALATNRPVSMIDLILGQTFTDKDVDVAAKPVSAPLDDDTIDSILLEYYDNRSPLYISVLLNVSLESVETCLLENKVLYCKGFPTYNLYCFMEVLSGEPSDMYSLSEINTVNVYKTLLCIAQVLPPAFIPKLKEDKPTSGEIRCIRVLLKNKDVFEKDIHCECLARVLGRPVQVAQLIVRNISMTTQS